ncbi:MAG TPA: hypothetical protein VM510_01895 [Caulifigura sp.]|nr:hypothetical protein [Caulifigura sp.]
MNGFLLVSVLFAAPMAESEDASGHPGTQLVFRSNTEIVAVDLRLTLAGEPIEPRWRQEVMSLAEHLDRNGDGALSRGEAGFLPGAASVREWLGGQISPSRPATNPIDRFDLDQDGLLQPGEVLASYRSQGVSHVDLVWRKNLVVEAANAALISILDHDGDGRVNRADLKQAWQSCSPLDQNGDGVLEFQELFPGIHGTRTASYQRVGDDDSTVAPPSVGVILGARYAGSDAARVVSFELDPKPQAGRPKKTILAPRRSLVIQCRTAPGVLPTEFEKFERTARERFQVLDTDRDQVVTSTEADLPHKFDMPALLRAADLDGDERLSAEELECWLKVQRAIAESRVLVEMTANQKSLFHALDENDDLRLSQRELRSAVARLQDIGAVSGEFLEISRIADQWSVTMSRGRVTRLPGPHASSPRWIQAMDTNQDGDISADEFRGPPDLFNQLDRDGDGLLSPVEAK